MMKSISNHIHVLWINSLLMQKHVQWKLKSASVLRQLFSIGFFFAVEDLKSNIPLINPRKNDHIDSKFDT